MVEGEPPAPARRCCGIVHGATASESGRDIGMVDFHPAAQRLIRVARRTKGRIIDHQAVNGRIFVFRPAARCE